MTRLSIFRVVLVPSPVTSNAKTLDLMVFIESLMLRMSYNFNVHNSPERGQGGVGGHPGPQRGQLRPVGDSISTETKGVQQRCGEVMTHKDTQ